MADQSLDAKTILTNPASAEFYALKSGTDYRITYENLVAALLTQISALESQITNSLQTVYELSKSADFTKVFEADTKIVAIDLRWISGTISIKIGTTLGGTEILPLVSVTDSQVIAVNMDLEASTTVYVTMSGGSASFAFDYLPNRFQ